MQLRDYQTRSIEAAYQHLRSRDDNPAIVIPTGGGKTPVIATICRDAVQVWNGRVLVLAHVKELLEQTVEKLRVVAPDLPIGVYSAGLRRRDLRYAVTVAGIQSIYKRACDLGPVDLIIIDEAHMVSADEGGDDGMYRQFLADAKIVCPHVRIIGLTATPFRMKTGHICSPDNILNHVCFEVGVKELIVQGYLSPLKTKAGIAKADTSGLHVRAGEFVASEVEELMDRMELVGPACAEIVELTANRRSVLIFASGVQHARHIAQTLQEAHGVECGFVCGDTSDAERYQLLKRFKNGGAGGLKYICNVNVLTTGFDAPNVDCVVLMRPTMSPGLYYQMVGRGFRLAPGKADCLVLDYGGNVLRHGPVDSLRAPSLPDQTAGSGEAPAKECPNCHALIAMGYQTCPHCGHAFPPPVKAGVETTATAAGILSGQITDTVFDVRETLYSIHTKRGAAPDSPRTLRVDYKIGMYQYKSEWVCLEHPAGSFARRKAAEWWRARSHAPVPATIDDAVRLADAGALAHTTSITVRTVAGEKYDRIIEHTFGLIPDSPPVFEQPSSCPDCGSEELRWQDCVGPHPAKEICGECGRFIRWITKHESEQSPRAEASQSITVAMGIPDDEIPF